MTDLPAEQAQAVLENEGAEGVGKLFGEYRDRLRGMLMLRVDHRLRGRIDPSDVIQEAFLEAQARLQDYLHDPKMSPYLWIRYLTMQRLLIMHRHHLQAKQRDARREISLNQPCDPECNSVNFASFIMASTSTPSNALLKAEKQGQLQQALEQMEPLDREVLALRHFEQLNNHETSEVLGITPGAASRRYYRALKKLKQILTDLFGEMGEEKS